MMGIAGLKARLRDIPGSERLTMQFLTGRQVYSFDGKIIAVDQNASEQDAEKAIRDALASPAIAQVSPAVSSASRMPSVSPAPRSMPSPTGFRPGEISGLFKSL